MDNQEAYERATRKVAAKIGFYIHLSAYVVVNIVLVVINLATSSEYLWFKWPLMGWGIGVFFHGMSVFVFSGFEGVKERMIEKELEKESKRRDPGRS
ncbi:MAG TPA: 2TM domain-containing protein [Syntrophorhabdales bacterium]|nr:2TM domain-containing protein [Syntrophorhabdales bacterium]